MLPKPPLYISTILLILTVGLSQAVSAECEIKSTHEVAPNAASAKDREALIKARLMSNFDDCLDNLFNEDSEDQQPVSQQMETQQQETAINELTSITGQSRRQLGNELFNKDVERFTQAEASAVIRHLEFKASNSSSAVTATTNQSQPQWNNFQVDDAANNRPLNPKTSQPPNQTATMAVNHTNLLNKMMKAANDLTESKGRVKDEDLLPIDDYSLTLFTDYQTATDPAIKADLGEELRIYLKTNE